jgi:hypothetical protein
MSIRDHWRSYDKEIIPPDAPETQIQECRRAFYAGAQMMMTEVQAALASNRPLSRLADLQRELDRFVAAVRRGKA